MVMAGNSTSSPRDHLADANPDVARKKQRVSEDADTSPSDSILVEAFEPEDIGGNIETAIEIEDDPSVAMDPEPYSNDFSLKTPRPTTFEQLGELLYDINANCYLDPLIVVNFSVALTKHLENTAGESSEWKLHYIDDEAEFFERVARVALGLLDAGELFEPGTDIDNPVMRQAFTGLLTGLERLSSRVIPFLSGSIKGTLSRRDSAQLPTQQQHVGTLLYVVVAAHVLVTNTNTAVYFQNHDRCLKLDATIARNRSQFYEGSMVSSLAVFVRTLGGAMREVKDSWLVLQSAIFLLNIALNRHHTVENYPKEQIEEVMEVICACILPAICEKHPRALPPDFHIEVVSFGMRALQSHALLHDQYSACRLYKRFVKSTTETNLPETTEEDSMETSLCRVGREDQAVLALLLSTAWSLQTAKAYICSDIMDIRYVGLSYLRKTLVDLYNTEKESNDGVDHPVIQHAVRFLRENEITKYIFGPESRAGLVSHSADIISFLAVTSTYTDAETDIIWQACSTSVEADFVKASFGILLCLMRWLDFGLLHHLAKKYSTTAVDKLGPDAVAFLPKLLKELEAKTISLNDRKGELDIAVACVEILKQASVAGRCSSTDPLRHISMTEIARFASPAVLLEDKAHIYKYCIPEILNHTQYATTGVEVLSIFLNVRLSSAETEHVLSMLPVSAAVNEFCSFVHNGREFGNTRSTISGAIVRLTCIARLMALTTTNPDKDLHDQLFAHAFGESALSNEARNVAWEKLNGMATTNSPPSAARSLWEGYMRDYVPSMAVNLATPKLIEFIIPSLSVEYANESVKNDVTQLLQHPLWKTLVRFATTSADNFVVKTATGAILNLLFHYPSQTNLAPALVAKCHGEFAKSHIADLCREYEESDGFKETTHLRKFRAGVDLLSSVLIKSRETASTYALAEQSNDLFLEGYEDESGDITFTVQVYGPEVQASILTVRAKLDTRVSELLSKLPDITGTSDNRVIACGSEVSQMPDKSLSEAGIRQSGSIMIRPKYTSTLDLDKVLTCLDPVEKEILYQYKSLEAFLDGAEPVAQKAFSFLSTVRLSALARSNVTSSEAKAQDLFPSDRPWRTLFSLFVLQKHLQDFARLGVVDRDFVMRSVRLLTTFVLDDTRQFDPGLMNEVMRALVVFLRGIYSSTPSKWYITDLGTERPQSDESLSYFADEPRFVSRIVELLFKVKLLPIERAPNPATLTTRTHLALTAYEALLLGCRTSATLWRSFAQDEANVELHRKLLLDEDLDFSLRIATPIKNFCADIKIAAAPRDAPNFYWQAIIPSLSQAMQSGALSEVYFDVATNVLHRDSILRDDETNLRELIQNLTSELWSYKRRESLPLLIADQAMGGLLRLLFEAITILRTYKKPLRLHGFPTRFLRDLLFPKSDDPQSHPLVHEDTRALVYDLVRLSFEPEDEYDDIIDIACEATHRSVRDVGMKFPGHADWIRPMSNGVGLRNLGMTCYMNSLLQQLYGNLQFRKFILDQPILESHKQDVLAQVQGLFARMQNGLSPCAEPNSLAQALNVQIGIQEDVHTFYTTLLSRLEDNMPDTETKFTLNKFFTGNSVTQVKGECGHVSSRTEPFTELSITVKNKASLHDSLDEFVQGEPLEGANKYMCMTCTSDDGGRLVNAMRRTCLDEIPDNLTFCLKRFTYEAMLEGENKVNDRFDFPKDIDMSLYKRSYLENPDRERETDIFELVGVIVHQGSLQYGHYWSYVRVPGSTNPSMSTWLYLEDGRSLLCAGGIQEVQEQCFGGQKWSNGSERPDNAYVLFYQRKPYIAQASLLNVDAKTLQPWYDALPRVTIPHEIAADIDSDNHWRWSMECLFTSQFSSFIVWLLDQYPSVIHARYASSEDRGAHDEEVEPTSPPDTVAKICDLIVNYTVRILLADPFSETRVDPLMMSLMSVLETSPDSAGHILNHVSQDAFAFANIVRHKSSNVRAQLFGALETCISYLQEHAPQSYHAILTGLIENHASLMSPSSHSLETSSGQWNEYLAFGANFARRGPLETGTILESGYLVWVLDIIYVPLDAEYRKRHTTLWNWMKASGPDLSPLFDFIFSLLSEHVDLSVDPEELPSSFEEPRVQTSLGWCLRGDEIHQLFREKKIQDSPPWMLFQAGSRNCAERSTWREYAPGKLLGLFVDNKAHDKIVRFVRDALLAHYENETNELPPLLLMTLHFCLHRSDEECRALLTTLGSHLVLWETWERKSLWFLQEAIKLTPLAVLDSIPMWAYRFLIAKTNQNRQRTMEWLRDHLFEPAPLSENAKLDASRIRSTRALFSRCQQHLVAAYNREQGRGRLESMIETMQHAKAYLTNLHHEVAKGQQNEGFRLSTEIQVEYDESRVVLSGLSSLLSDLTEWEPETILPTRPIDVQRSVEVDSDDAETSDAEGDELSASEL